jgi:hypothetical protein
VLCLTGGRSAVAARYNNSSRVWRYVRREGSAEVRAFVSRCAEGASACDACVRA